MDIKDLPTKGEYYGSGELATELIFIADNVLSYEKPRCDCSSVNRCCWCILEQELLFKKETMKKRLQDFVISLEAKNENTKRY